MTTTTLVAGATGYLGRFIVAELHRQGHRVRAIARDQRRAESPGPWEAPALEGLVDEWAIGNVTDPDFVTSIADGVDTVISALGVTRQKADPWDIDYQANLDILRSAEMSGVQSFCYVHVIGGKKCPTELTKAKNTFAQALAASPISSQIVNPSGYFSDMIEILKMAQRGRVYFFRRETKLNPIHGADLAKYCVDRLMSGEEGEWNVGGPEIFNWEGLAHCAFRALGRPAKITTLPPAILPPLITVTGLFSAKYADMLRFLTWSMLNDSVGDTVGTHRLLEFYRRHAKDQL